MLTFGIVALLYLISAGVLLFGLDRWWPGGFVLGAHGVIGISFFIWTCWYCSYPGNFS